MTNVIDFRVSTWGHNMEFSPQNDGTFRGACWYRGNIEPGDTVLWETNYGHCEAEVLFVERERDPSDMFWVTSLVTRRVANPEIVSQEELDRAYAERPVGEHFARKDEDND